MENLIEFATKYYIVFIIISSLLVLALIGYVANRSFKKDVSIKKKKEKLVQSANEQSMPVSNETPKMWNWNSHFFIPLSFN